MSGAGFQKNTMATYKLNWRPSPFDERDFKFSAMPGLDKIAIPEQADLQASLPEVFDQGRVGSCTGNAGAMLGLHVSRLQKREISPSRLMLYYGAREEIGQTEYDEGAYIRDIFKAWAKAGVAPESTWPYVEANATLRPSSDAYTVAKKTLATEYRAIDGSRLEELQTCIAMGYPFEFGFRVFASFMQGDWKDTMPIPKASEKILGGHAVAAIGYDNARQAFKIKNSWGLDWKDGGHFWMPYRYITNSDFCEDFWMLTGITPGDAPIPTPDNVTSIIDAKKVFTEKFGLVKLRKEEICRIGSQMGVNVDFFKSKAYNVAIVAGALGL